MSYRWEFVNSRKIGDKWGYKVYMSLYANTCPRGRLGSFMSDEGILTVNTFGSFLADNAGSEIEAFIEQNEDGLTVPVNVDDLVLENYSPLSAADENDKVVFGTRGATLATASLQVNTLPFSVADTIPPSQWTVNRGTRKINLSTPEIPLVCTASFIGKLDLNPILPLQGTFTISELIDRGALVEYLSFPTVTASTATVDW